MNVRGWIRSNVAGLVAIFIALGGVAVAATTAPKNSVVSKSIKNGKVRNVDIGDSQITTEKLVNGSVTPQKLANPTPGGPPSGAAGGALAGSYPNPALANGAVTPSKIGAIPAARVFRDSNQAIPGNVGTDLTFNSEYFDTEGLHSTTTNTNRLTAPIGGVYSITAHVRWADNTVGSRSVAITRGAVQERIAADWRNATNSPCCGGITDQTVTTTTRLGAGQFVSVEVFQDSGVSLEVQRSGVFSPEFSMVWLGP